MVDRLEAGRALDLLFAESVVGGAGNSTRIKVPELCDSDAAVRIAAGRLPKNSSTTHMPANNEGQCGASGKQQPAVHFHALFLELLGSRTAPRGGSSQASALGRFC